jgi:GNAT superfamily N-acetyltransferase
LVRVVTTTLEMLKPPARAPRALPDDVRLDHVTAITPEYARFLYGMVGGPWFWVDRLGWTREQWAAEIGVPGTEFRVLYGDGLPLGFAQLQPQVTGDRTSVEIRYFGLAESAIGRGMGRALLEHALAAAWSIGDRAGLPPVARVWVHTCTLDGPAALSNYKARGMVPCAVQETDEPMPDEPLGSWASTGGPR